MNETGLRSAVNTVLLSVGVVVVVFAAVYGPTWLAGLDTWARIAAIAGAGGATLLAANHLAQRVAGLGGRAMVDALKTLLNGAQMRSVGQPASYATNLASNLQRLENRLAEATENARLSRAEMQFQLQQLKNQVEASMSARVYEDKVQTFTEEQLASVTKSLEATQSAMVAEMISLQDRIADDCRRRFAEQQSEFDLQVRRLAAGVGATKGISGTSIGQTVQVDIDPVLGERISVLEPNIDFSPFGPIRTGYGNKVYGGSQVAKVTRDIRRSDAPRLGEMHARLMSRLDLSSRSLAKDLLEAQVVEHMSVLSPSSLQVCRGLPCEIAGARRLALELEHPGQTQQVRCLGHCERAPAACLGDAVLAPVSSQAIGRALDGGPLPAGEHAPVEYVDYRAYRVGGGYNSLEHRPRVHTDAEALLEMIARAGLHGPEDEPALGATLVVDAVAQREGDFRDRALLELDPHRVMEGAILAAASFGTTRIEIRLAAEFQACREVLEAEIETLHQDLPVSGIPRVKVVRGAAGTPALTSVMEVETLYWLREVWERGAQAFAAHGRRGFRGRRAVAVSGRVAKPGLKLVPAGSSVREIIDLYCGGIAGGGRLAAFVAGVPFTPAQADLLFEEAVLAAQGGDAGRGALIVLDERDLALVERLGLR